MFFTEVISMFARFQARGAFVAAVKFDFAFKVKRGEKGGKRGGKRKRRKRGDVFPLYNNCFLLPCKAYCNLSNHMRPIATNDRTTMNQSKREVQNIQ